MHYQTFISRNRGRAVPLQNIVQWVYKRWFQVFILGLVLHVVFNKDISINVNVKDVREGASKTSLSAPVGDRSAKAGFAFGIWPETKSRRTAAAGGNNRWQPSDFSNLSFILNRDLSAREGVPEQIVQEKLEHCRRYVERFAKIAIAEMERFEIPASILLAQGLLATDAGMNPLAAEANNHFELQCIPDCERCACRRFTGDVGFGLYRVFENPWQSYREQSLILRSETFHKLSALKRDAYQQWAKGLEEIAFSDHSDYAAQLIKIIESLDLFQFDR